MWKFSYCDKVKLSCEWDVRWKSLWWYKCDYTCSIKNNSTYLCYCILNRVVIFRLCDIIFLGWNMNGNRMSLIYSFIFINTESEHIDGLSNCHVHSVCSQIRYRYLLIYFKHDQHWFLLTYLYWKTHRKNYGDRCDTKREGWIKWNIVRLGIFLGNFWKIDLISWNIKKWTFVFFKSFVPTYHGQVVVI